MWLLRLFWLCLPLSLALSGLLEPQVLVGPGVLRCGLQSFWFTVDIPAREGAPVLTAWDKQGLPHLLRNNSDCGTWVREGPGSSVVLEASYSGCYVTEWGSQYIMPVRVEGTDTAGRKMLMKRRLLRCPVDRPAPDAPDADLCDSVPARDRLPCAPPPISRGDCEVLGCCYGSEEEEAGSCYYGNTVTSHCTQEGHFSIAVSRSAASPPLHLDSVYLAFGNDSKCDPVMATRAFVLFHFPFTSCGTTRRTAGDQVVYENELVATRDVRTWGHGSITRDSIFRLRVSCSYAITGNTFPVNVQVLTLPPPLAKAQPGALALELQIAKDKNYSSYYAAGDYPVVKVLRDPIYIEVSVLHRTDPNLGLFLRQCWATPSPSPLRQPQWPILVEGCPYTGDNYQTHLIPVQKAPSLPFPSHHQRFSISTFSFVDPARAKEALGGQFSRAVVTSAWTHQDVQITFPTLPGEMKPVEVSAMEALHHDLGSVDPQVYLHCSVSVCQPAGTSSCTVTCPVTSGRKYDLYLQNNTASISSSGPMILLQALKDPLEKSHKYLSAPVDAKALWVAGLSGTLLIGALLVFYLATRRRR